MTITAADLVFFRAEQPTDLATGGGRRTSIAVQDGAENNIFPDIPPAFRAGGGVQIRKVYPSVVSADDDVLMQAQMRIAQPPADPAIDVVLFAYGDQQTTRAQALARLESSHYLTLWPVAYTATNDPATLVFDGIEWRAGMRAGLLYFGGVDLSELATAIAVIAHPNGSYEVTFSRSMPQTFQGQPSLVAKVFEEAEHPRGAATVTAPVSAGATVVSLDRVEARVVPNVLPFPTAVAGLSNPGRFSRVGGRVPIFRPSEPVVISGGGASEVAIVSHVDYRAGGGLELAAPLVGSYPAGSVVSSLLDFGDMGASVGPSFSQQTWTKSFSDAIIGQPLGANYDRSYPIATTNLGAITERWALIFTSATAFRLIGERVGQVATGSTGDDFSPLNPLTNTPFFTVPAGGWGQGWGIGNVLRFNTRGAYPGTWDQSPPWLVRCVSPSSPGGLDGSMIELRGGVNA